MLTMLTQLLHTRCLESSTIDMHNSYSFGNSAKRQKRVGWVRSYSRHMRWREREERERVPKRKKHISKYRDKKKKACQLRTAPSLPHHIV